MHVDPRADAGPDASRSDAHVAERAPWYILLHGVRCIHERAHIGAVGHGEESPRFEDLVHGCSYMKILALFPFMKSAIERLMQADAGCLIVHSITLPL